MPSTSVQSKEPKIVRVPLVVVVDSTTSPLIVLAAGENTGRSSVPWRRMAIRTGLLAGVGVLLPPP
jgi:hypothetical protein